MDNIEKAHEARDIDLSGAARGVWLVKVPKYLAEQWQKADTTTDVGKLRISKSKVPGGKPDVIFTLNDQSQFTVGGTSQPNALPDVPKDHKFVLTGIAKQSLSILSETPNTEYELNGGPIGYVSIDGTVIQRAECRPLGDTSYMNMKRSQMEISNKPAREVVQLDRVVTTYKPISSHPSDRAQAQKKKEAGKKSRMEKDKVLDMLYGAFEKHQYYNVKDLERLTRQPMPYLKEILKEICTYNMKAPHRNMWELKAEYRHYKSDT